MLALDVYRPWIKRGNVNSWRKWLELDSGEPLPESAVAVFRTVQANWAVPEKISGTVVGGMGGVGSGTGEVE